MKLYSNLNVVFFFLLFSSLANAQTNPTIRTGRPGQSIGPYVVGTGYLQVQSGIGQAWAWDAIDQKSFLSDHVIRFGLTESFEISSVLNYQYERIKTATPSISNSGINNVQVGFRYNIIDKPEKWIPGLGIQTRFKLPLNSSDYSIDYPSPVILLATQHRLNPDVLWFHNVGISYDGVSSNPRYVFTSNLAVSLSEKWGAFVEVYGNVRSFDTNIYWDTGLAYLLNNDLQIDMYGGLGRNDGVTDGFVSVGVSWRTQTFE